MVETSQCSAGRQSVGSLLSLLTFDGVDDSSRPTGANCTVSSLSELIAAVVTKVDGSTYQQHHIRPCQVEHVNLRLGTQALSHMACITMFQSPPSERRNLYRETLVCRVEAIDQGCYTTSEHPFLHKL